jgi:RNA polymerase sigma-70 factor (ECF subfamily)
MSANQKQQCELSDYAIRLIRHRARRLVATAGFAAQDIEDIRQDLIVDLLERLPKFDPAKATCNTFVARIIDRKVAKLIRDRNCEKRDPRREECSLNECIDDGEGGSVERIQTIAADEADRRLGRQARSDQETAELALDVEEVLKRLPDNLRRLCELLKTGSIADAARAMGVPRTTLHDHVKKLREVFEAAGLRDYLAGRPSSGECAG